MALLAFSSRLANSSNVFAEIASFKHKPSRDPNSATAKIPPINSYRAIRPLLLPSPSSSSKSVVAKGAWQPKYVYPDPNPDFARTETAKFQVELMRSLSKNKETFGKDVEEVVSVCSEIFSNFLHKEYGGPGTLLVEPFTDMLLALKEKKLPGPPVAARAALLWAQNYVDRDWEIWTPDQASP
ncbi:hypothetical protein KSP39_PZI013495 [Platanthera zijinensis]|uniref:Uncharacterized protein n=1 Tax=Platanthera zijinensis TaxID=2320716 RepID=A0AAP0BDC6_9ASPA